MQLLFRVNHRVLLVHKALMWMGMGRQSLSLFQMNDGLAGGRWGRHDLLCRAYASPQLLMVSAWGWDAMLLLWGLCEVRATWPYLHHWVCYIFQKSLNTGITARCKNTMSINKDKFNYNLIWLPVTFLVLPFFFVLMERHYLVNTCSVC